jgi:hypothetical protein
MSDKTPVDTEQKPSMLSKLKSFFSSNKEQPNTVQSTPEQPKVGGRGRRRKSLRRRRRRHIKSTHRRRKY